MTATVGALLPHESQMGLGNSVNWCNFGARKTQLVECFRNSVKLLLELLVLCVVRLCRNVTSKLAEVVKRASHRDHTVTQLRVVNDGKQIVVNQSVFDDQVGLFLCELEG